MDDYFPVNRAPRVFRDRLRLDNYTNTEIRRKFRLERERIQAIVDEVEPIIGPKTARSHAIEADTKVLTALQYYATGSFMEPQADCLHVSKSSVSRIIGEVTPIVAGWAPRYIRMPTTEEDVKTVQQQFGEIAGMPFVIGAIDGSLINIIAPRENEAAYVDRHGSHSLNAMAVCDSKCRFTYLNVKWPGATNDAFVFRQSNLCGALENGQFQRRPYSYLLGDSAYALKKYLMTPVLHPTTAQEIRYNRAHRGTRQVIETAFGQLKMTFRCLDTTGGVIMLEPRKGCQLITGCMVLHNIRKADGMADPDEPVEYRIEEEMVDGGQGDEEGRQVRNNIITRLF